ncbi:hypothetical protein DCS_04995 [Drechmeria coniospora]|uniref:Uncharacterized protein n=1 Tax=Drechmeria coniospora TaxID=98403 RepID=A0A151GLU8_DRECN|nr:hypothetical protein DCS_04995 [Drechmeria coniospora]KYK57982.1 hypothetical protein DCS_04995 [Drechmeria coniospora]
MENHATSTASPPWLKTIDSCYITEYDLIEYAGDFSADLKYCGQVSLDITRQAAAVRYLSECKWAPSTSSESMQFYGRDVDVTLTCWTEGYTKIMGDWCCVQTTDNCHVSGSGLWKAPDRSKLNNCGPGPGPRINETRRSIDAVEESPALKSKRNEEDDPPSRRWLQAEKIGEEYAPCFSCASGSRNSTCGVVKTYEFNDTVVSQCLTSEDVAFPNGSFSSKTWMIIATRDAIVGRFMHEEGAKVLRTGRRSVG